MKEAPDGEEMIIVQSNIEPQVVHSVKLIKLNNREWTPSLIELIYNKTANVIDLK